MLIMLFCMLRGAEKGESRCQINIRLLSGPSYQIFMLNDLGRRLDVLHLAPLVGECWIFSWTGCVVFRRFGTLCPLESVSLK